ncbi:MAG TPA: DUF3419 family protein [Vulgatibacter sp.]
MGNPIKFAVVREDPAVEEELVRVVGAEAALVVASGGCTALDLAHGFPNLRVTAFDRSPAQLAHVAEKNRALATADRTRLNVEDPRTDGLNQRGEFEGLFRMLRGLLVEFVASGAELASFFHQDLPSGERAELVDRWLASPYWPVAFELAFANSLLVAMFGPDAIQHADAGSYPGYFQRAFERGLRRADAPRNPFLQHVLLGCYRAGDGPAYLKATAALPIELVEGSLVDVPDLDSYQVFGLSNVFDWSDDALVERWAQALRAARPGSAVVIRQLNNRRDLRRFFAPHFVADGALAGALLEQERSLFYDRLEVLFRTEAP